MNEDKIECPECGSENYKIEDCPEEYTVYYTCPNCGHESSDGYEDLYGCMSVPWGGLL